MATNKKGAWLGRALLKPSRDLNAYAQMVASGQEEDREGLRSRAAEFDATLVVLQQGGRVLDVEVAPAPPEVRAVLGAVANLCGIPKPDLDLVTVGPRNQPGFQAAYGRIEARIDEAARRIGDGDFSQRLDITTKDERATLAGTFNQMTAQVEQLLESLNLRRQHTETIIEGIPVGLLVLRSLAQRATRLAHAPRRQPPRGLRANWSLLLDRTTLVGH